MTTPHDSLSPTELQENHQTELIKARLDAAHQHSYLKDFVYGAIDGAVTTFAVVSGVAGAGLSSNIVVILGVANLIGDGFSMAAGNYLGTRAEAEQREQMRRMEERHVKECPEGEREEIRLIFQEKGFEGELLEQVVETITADRTRWVETMLREEHGLSLEAPSAMKAATTTFVAFLLVGLLPLIPFLIALIPSITLASPYLLSTAMTAAAFFLVGAAKSRFVETSWIYAGMETLFVGGLAAGLAYVCGLLLRGIG